MIEQNHRKSQKQEGLDKEGKLDLTYINRRMCFHYARTSSTHRAKNVIYNWKYKKVPNNPLFVLSFFLLIIFSLLSIRFTITINNNNPYQ